MRKVKKGMKQETFFSYALVAEDQSEPKEVEMESITSEGRLFDVGSLYAEFSQLHDSRKARGKRYRLEIILTLIVLAKICGEDKPSAIAEWAKHRLEWLCEALKLERKSMPHRSSYERILERVVNWEDLERLVSQVLCGRRYFGKQVLVAIDGKVLRGTLDEKQEGVYLLAAYLPEEGIVLMEVAVKGKGHEIEAAPQVLKSIDLRDKVVIGDALHTQRAVSIQIVESGGDYVWFVKGNQPQLEEDLRLWFGPDPEPIPGQAYLPKDFETAKSVNKGHGRIEQRILIVSSQLKDFLDWPYLEQVFKLERRFIFTKTGEVEQQVVYGITSLAREEITPQALLQMTRSYWGIENGLHYRRDVSLREDQTRMTRPNAARVMACLNNLVLGLLIGKKKYRYLPTARRFFAANPNQALALLTRL
jgi:predicted transposase YbfD/YdcC